MQIDRAIALAAEYGYVLKPGASQWVWDLKEPGNYGEYIDTLPTAQILQLKEEDFVEFYLQN